MTNRAEVQSLQPGPMKINLIELNYSNNAKYYLFSNDIEIIRSYVRQIKTIQKLNPLNDETLLRAFLKYDEYMEWANRLPYEVNGLAQIVKYTIYQVENFELCEIEL